MKLFRFLIIIFACFFLPLRASATNDSTIELFPFKADISDKASLQRGAKLFMNYCSGCHSLQYMRYNQLAEGIGMVDEEGKLLDAVVKRNLIFNGGKITDAIRSSLTATEAKRWFGVVPPDLTLEARVRGVRWLYTYLRTFYRDDSRPFGTNNLVFVDVGMPNVLLDLQGEQLPVYREEQGRPEVSPLEVDHLSSPNNGRISSQEFDQAITDLVNFLAYTAEPMKIEQHHIGYWVLGFLVILLVLVYLLKREYWRDIR